jgi:succinyldiaminopimelate transaminase
VSAQAQAPSHRRAEEKGFSPPPYPYARLAKLAEVARAHEGGMVDLSVGTPCDPAPVAVMEAFRNSRTAHPYPASVGSAEFRAAASGWIERRFGVRIDPSRIAGCVGTKEFVASTATYLRLKEPLRDTVVGPALAYPTYEMSAQLAGGRYFGVLQSSDGKMDLSSIPDEVTERALMLWLNSPSNPDGTLGDLEAAARWGRTNGVPVFSDECYTEFTWDPASPSTVLSSGPEGVVAVHSLSKRSNMAGMRVGFYAGDPWLVGFLSSVRQHAGLMVPGPVQEAAVVALNDHEHVIAQRRTYRRRLENLAATLRRAGLDAHLPAGGFYLWVRAPAWAEEAADRDAEAGASWILASALAEAAGALVSPGEFYGDGGSRFVRVAVVQPDDRLALLSERLERSSHPRLGIRSTESSATARGPGAN